jgi:hypothetical protein
MLWQKLITLEFMFVEQILLLVSTIHHVLNRFDKIKWEMRKENNVNRIMTTVYFMSLKNKI